MILDVGATWGKWDLHVHTPLSFHHRYSGNGEDIWEKFVLDLEKLPEEFKVLGINDYYFVGGYKKLLKEKEKGRLANIDLLLPVIELRLESLAGNADLQRINLHVIFSNELEPEEIEQHFISNLRINFEISPGNVFNEVLSEGSLESLGEAIRQVTPVARRGTLPGNKELGFNNLVIKIEKIFEALQNHRFSDKHLIGLGKTEWDALRWDGAAALKRDIISKTDFLFSATTGKSAYVRARKKLIEQEVNSNLLDCSDAHAYSDHTRDKDRIGNCATWIKAERSFNGLKHTLHEFEDRVFIGDVPEKLERIKNNPSHYLESVQITKRPNSNFREKWFNQTIPLNPDLVSIIGNKGNGKSALADIIGLVGDTRNYASFSFLDKQKFREPKGNPAQFFQATAQWRSGSSETKFLNEDPNGSNAEKVKYIPQNHIEELCNELSSSPESAFEKELKNVIFSHLESAQRLGKESLDDLLKYRSEQIEKSISMLVFDLREINSEILALERRLKNEFKMFHEKALKQKQDELVLVEKDRPKEVAKPETDEGTKAALDKTNAEIEELNKQHLEITSTIKAKGSTKATMIKKVAELKKVVEKAKNLQSSIDKFTEEVSPVLQNSNIDLSSVLSAKIDLSSLNQKISDSEKDVAAIEHSLNPDLESSLVSKCNQIELLLKEKRESLDVPNQSYQKFRSDLKGWEERKAALIGNKELEGTIKFHEAMLSSIKQAPVELETYERRRDEKSKEVYRKINELVEVYKELYKPVQEFIKTFDWSKDILALNFQVEVVNSGFEDGFFGYVSQAVKGSFCGQEPGKQFVGELLAKANLNTEDGAIDFVRQVINCLRTDHRSDKKEDADVEKQMRKGKDPVDLYNFLSGFEFLRPRYVLKVGNKELPQLSPGERGLLLLVFYLLVDRSSIPIVIDQPEGNLDNQTVKHLLVPAIKDAKKRRQVFLVTHNPNLAVVCDSEQVIYAYLDKVNQNEIVYESGAIENCEINKRIVDVLEGTWPAFDNRQRKYRRPQVQA